MGNEPSTVRHGPSPPSPVAAAEAEYWRARAAAETARAAADVDMTRTRRWLRVARAGLGVGAAAAVIAPLAWLARDYYVNESRDYIRASMLKKLRECPAPPSADALRPQLLPVAQEPLTLGHLPQMLLGPTGSGKSTLLADLARKAVAAPAPAPTVFVRLRVPSSEGGAGRPEDESVKLMDSVAAQFYEQIGYPRRRSILGDILSRGFTFRGERNHLELAAESNRLIAALGLLFSVCEELRSERVAAGIPPLDAAPVLLFDEVQDLVKDARLKAAGGDFIFRTLATLIVAYGVDREVVRVVVAGSSAELYFAFQATTAKGNRWSVYTLDDPAPDVVAGALEARGYSRDEARDMIALCGTRMRLLREPLVKGAAGCGAATFLAKTAADGRASIGSLFSRLDAEDAAQLARLLDAVAAADGAGGARSAARPKKEALPKCLHNADVSNVVYVTTERQLFFQSQAVARAWASVRGDYAAARQVT
jgi:hypothetical protein